MCVLGFSDVNQRQRVLLRTAAAKESLPSIYRRFKFLRVYRRLWVSWVFKGVWVFMGVYRYLRESMVVIGFSDVNQRQRVL